MGICVAGDHLPVEKYGVSGKCSVAAGYRLPRIPGDKAVPEKDHAILDKDAVPPGVRPKLNSLLLLVVQPLKVCHVQDQNWVWASLEETETREDYPSLHYKSHQFIR